jgi:hypothetical protein
MKKMNGINRVSFNTARQGFCSGADKFEKECKEYKKGVNKKINEYNLGNQLLGGPTESKNRIPRGASDADVFRFVNENEIKANLPKGTKDPTFTDLFKMKNNELINSDANELSETNDENRSEENKNLSYSDVFNKLNNNYFKDQEAGDEFKESYEKFTKPGAKNSMLSREERQETIEFLKGEKYMTSGKPSLEISDKDIFEALALKQQKNVIKIINRNSDEKLPEDTNDIGQIFNAAYELYVSGKLENDKSLTKEEIKDWKNFFIISTEDDIEDKE